MKITVETWTAKSERALQYINLYLPEKRVEVLDEGGNPIPPEDWLYDPVIVSEEDGRIEAGFTARFITEPEQPVHNDAEVFTIEETEEVFRRRFEVTREISQRSLKHRVLIDDEFWFMKETGEREEEPITRIVEEPLWLRIGGAIAGTATAGAGITKWLGWW